MGTTHGMPSLLSIRSALSLKGKSVASPNSVCSSVSVLNSTAWVTSTTSTGTVRAKKPSKTITKATPSKLRSSKLTLRKNVSLSASNSSATTQWLVATCVKARPSQLPSLKLLPVVSKLSFQKASKPSSVALTCPVTVQSSARSVSLLATQSTRKSQTSTAT